jgi:MinD superfamily P-loop ATPase
VQIAVASGKGGVGKTTVAVSLALSLVPQHLVYYLDCDVEAPNGHLSLQPTVDWCAPAVVMIPEIDAARCQLCGQCVTVCQFHALAQAGGRILVLPELCHGCGSCTWNCPEGAVREVPHPIGILETGMTPDGVRFAQGRLTISEPMPTPIIRQLKRAVTPLPQAIVIRDAPPGASCAVVETVRGADFVLLVAEPTPFGLHDLRQMLAIVAEMGLNAGAVINRAGIGDDGADNAIHACLAEHDTPVLLRIPFSRDLAAGLAAGRPLVAVQPTYRVRFQQLYAEIAARVQPEVA